MAPSAGAAAPAMPESISAMPPGHHHAHHKMAAIIIAVRAPRNRPAAPPSSLIEKSSPACRRETCRCPRPLRRAERMGLDPTTLNRNLKPLEAQGFVADTADPTDRRVRVLQITHKGANKLGETVPFWRQAQARVEKALGSEATLALNALLDLSSAKLTE
jgi:MarR family